MSAKSKTTGELRYSRYQRQLMGNSFMKTRVGRLESFVNGIMAGDSNEKQLWSV